jgi:hypothetical protein
LIGVVLHGAVAVEMIRRQVEQDAGGRVDRGREVDLVGRAFDHIEAVGRRRIERHDGAADIAAHLRVAAGGLEDVRVSAVVVDLPLVPVIAMNGALGAAALRSRPNSSTSPMISTPAPRANSTVQCGLGWVSGTPGDSTKARNAGPVGLAQVGCDAPRLSRATLSGLSSQADHLGSARPSALRAVAIPGAAEAEERDTLAIEGRESRDHPVTPTAA